MSQILVSGSIAYDYIMNFGDEFGKYILPEKTYELSVSFNIDSLEKHDGGAWHNISYNLWLLEQESILLWAVGKDFTPSEFNKKWINYDYTSVSEKYLTAVANIINDQESNQITTFYPGAIFESADVTIDQVKEDISIAIVSPNSPVTMQQHVKWCAEKWIPVIFDPGQPLPAFSKEQLRDTLTHANYLMVNEYELDLLCKIAEIQESEILDYVEAYIVTLGSKWSRYTSKTESFEVPAKAIENLVDPTWAWDSYRAWILHALHHGLGWKTWMEKWTELAAACIQCSGTQNHTI